MKKVCLAVLLTLIWLSCQATEFMIGAYAQYDLWNPGAGTNISTLKTKLLDGHFNAVKMSIKDQDLNGLGTALTVLGSDVKTILEDRYWDPSSGQVGIHSLTYGNYLKLEAEYMYRYIDDLTPPDDTLFTFIVDDLTTALDPTGLGDVYNYVFAHAPSCGKRRGPGNHSNQYTWECDEALGHKPGLALSNPRFRWRIPGHTYPRSIGYDLKFLPSDIKNNKLYFTVAMKYSDLTVGAEVATIKLKVLKGIASKHEFMDYTKDAANYIELDLHPVNPEVGTTIYNNKYSSVPRDADQDGNNLLFEYYIEFPSASSSDLLRKDGAGDFFLHINPEIYWHGNGRMELDYIVLEDEYHRQAGLSKSGSNVFTMLETRMNQILAQPNSDNIIYHYTKDEPFQGQFAMYDQVESYLENVYGSEDSPQLLTAINLEGARITKPNGNIYEHYLNFLAQAKPRAIAVDAYPLAEWGSTDLIRWNNDSDPLSVQKRIDRIVTKTYKSLAQAVRLNQDLSVRETEIIYIPQTFGEYVPDTANGVLQWRYFKPPRSMNKCLQLLPLCYSADGILDFALLAGTYPYGASPAQYYRLAPLMHGSHYTGIHAPEDDSAFEHLSVANQKIAVYGPYLSQQNWKDADCLMTSGGTEGVNLSPYFLQDLRVHDPHTSAPSGSAPTPYYNGYVQCGYYSDDQLSPSFMLVNRRAVFRTGGDNSVVQLPVDDSFIDADSQTVIFVPSLGAEAIFGSHIGLYDPFDGQIYRPEDTQIRIDINPGDGKLLEMCGTLPPDVSVNCVLSGKAVLEGKITIKPGINVTFTNATRIKKNASIYIGDGASLSLGDKVVVEEGVRIFVAPTGILSAECDWGQGSVIHVTEGMESN
ncbi:MAG: hypothetical protein CVU48_01810 [Candidatus Cloacimonetes bacterium HGW-Cloacimonetes-1]|nr:MAG: hypothetical protein CVU48_01810 [Candidatus Cloacimonetes bacterium HGW-Cloacimonetes-1]